MKFLVRILDEILKDTEFSVEAENIEQASKKVKQEFGICSFQIHS